MNEVLFRAYDEGRKEYLSDGNLFIAINKGRNPHKSEIYLDEISNADKYKERFVIERYTGLTDKHGNKIFEGDILKYYVWGTYECFAVVRIGEYEQDGSGDEYPAIKVCGVYAEVKKYCPLIKGDGDYFPEYLKKSSLLEIGIDNFDLVGNIHDNPKLLNSQ